MFGKLSFYIDTAGTFYTEIYDRPIIDFYGGEVVSPPEGITLDVANDRININQSILNIEKMLSRLIGENIELQLKLNPDVMGFKADKDQIDQVLMNLVINAHDAIEGNGKIVIGTSNVFIDKKFLICFTG